jgi:hypothetical protein
MSDREHGARVGWTGLLDSISSVGGGCGERIGWRG